MPFTLLSLTVSWARAAVAVLATGLALALPTAAWSDTNATINPGNVPTTAEDFDTHMCEANFGGGPYPDQDVWVFVRPDYTRDFVSVTAGGAARAGYLVVDKLATPTLLEAADAGSAARGVELAGTEQIPVDATGLAPAVGKLVEASGSWRTPAASASAAVRHVARQPRRSGQECAGHGGDAGRRLDARRRTCIGC
jgi:hypothetical protein